MFILTKGGENFINYNNIVSLRIFEQCQFSGTRWQIMAVYSGGFFIVDEYCTKQECKNAFDKLCSKIADSKEYEVIDVSELWSESWY